MKIHLLVWTLALNATVTFAQPTTHSPTGESTSTYTVAQILSRHEDNWSRLRELQFVAIRIQSMGASDTSTNPNSASPISPRASVPSPLPRPGINPQPISSPAAADYVRPFASPAQGSSFTAGLPQSPELLIAGIADLSTRRAISLVLPGQAALIYRRRGGEVIWTGQVRATITDGAAQQVFRLTVPPQPQFNRRREPIPETRLEGLSKYDRGNLADPAFTAALDFHPRRLTDLPWLVQAWERNQPVSITRISPNRLRIESRDANTVWQAHLAEDSSMLPEIITCTQNGIIVERRTLLLREVGGVWLGARLLVERADGYREMWHYDSFSANQGMPSQGVSAGFLRLPDGVELPPWLRPDPLPAMPQANSSSKSTQ